jgi:t-SNARE complex subunit (syntaxin)
MKDYEDTTENAIIKFYQNKMRKEKIIFVVILLVIAIIILAVFCLIVYLVCNVFNLCII